MREWMADSAQKTTTLKTDNEKLKQRVAALENASGAAVATMSKSENSEGGNVTARNPAGGGVFGAGHRGDLGGGEACVYRAKRENIFCIGITAR